MEEKEIIEEDELESEKELLNDVVDDSRIEPEYNLEAMNEKEIEDTYLGLVAKEQRKEVLTKKEKEFKTKVDEAISRSEEENFLTQKKRELEDKEKSLEEKEAFLKEYMKVKETDPSKVVQAHEKELSLKGGDSVPKLIKFILKMRKVKKKGGKILVQVYRNKRVTIKWTAEDVTYVEFISRDEKGNELIEVTRFNKFIYSYEGTPVPVLFAIQGVAEGYSFFENFQSNITSEMVSRLHSRAYQAGYEKGAEQTGANKKDDVLTKFMPIIVVIILIAIIGIGYLMFQIYNDNSMILEALEVIKASRGGVTILP